MGLLDLIFRFVCGKAIALGSSKWASCSQVQRYSFFFKSVPRRINFFHILLPSKVYVVCICSFNQRDYTILVLSHIIKIKNNSKARLVINLRLYKNPEQKCRMEECEFTPKFIIFHCAFFEYKSSSLFVKYVTFF